MNTLYGIRVTASKYLPRTVHNALGDEVELLGVIVNQRELDRFLFEPTPMLGDWIPPDWSTPPASPPFLPAFTLLTGDVVTPANKEPRE